MSTRWLPPTGRPRRRAASRARGGRVQDEHRSPRGVRCQARAPPCARILRERRLPEQPTVGRAAVRLPGPLGWSSRPAQTQVRGQRGVWRRRARWLATAEDPLIVPWRSCTSAHTSAAPRRRAVQDELEKILQIFEGLVRTTPESLEWLIEAIHPHGWIAERLRADGIPSRERRKKDLLLRQTQLLHAQSIGAWVRFVCAVRVRADKSVEQSSQPGILRVRLKHPWAEIRERDHANAG